MSLAAPFFFLLFIAFIILVIWFGISQAAKRRKELAAWAQAHGCTFDESRRNDMDDEYPRFHCLRQGSGRYAHNRIFGALGGRDFLFFDYHYETHSTNGKGQTQTHHHYFSGIVLKPPFPLHYLFIRPENFLDKIGEFFGMDDIDFESAEFSGKYCVKSDDKKWAYDVLHARAMQFLLDHPGYQIVFDAMGAIVWNGRVWKPGDIDNALATLEGLLDQLPDYLVQQRRGAQGESQ